MRFVRRHDETSRCDFSLSFVRHRQQCHAPRLKAKNVFGGRNVSTRSHSQFRPVRCLFKQEETCLMSKATVIAATYPASRKPQTPPPQASDLRLLGRCAGLQRANRHGTPQAQGGAAVQVKHRAPGLGFELVESLVCIHVEFKPKFCTGRGTCLELPCSR